MHRLFACANCQRYILESESHCPFCGDTAFALEVSSVPSLPRGRSRAAVFAMRTALAAGIAPALACGGTSDAHRERAQDVSGTGGSSAGGTGGSESAIAMNGSGNGGGGSPSGSGGSGANGIIIDVEPDPQAPDAGDGGFAPVPIYGGVFPDPLARVRV
jgi:hypothetical protein